MRWGIFQRQPDRFYNAFDIFKHVAVPEPNDTITTFRQFSAPQRISVETFAMLAAIQLDSKFARRARKVDKPSADWMLAAKLPLREVFS